MSTLIYERDADDKTASDDDPNTTASYALALEANLKQEGQLLPWDGKRFVLKRKLGRGSYGQVFIAQDQSKPTDTKGTQIKPGENWVVIKRLPKRTSPIKSALREWNILRALQSHCHPYILCYRGGSFYYDSQYYYLTTEYLG